MNYYVRTTGERKLDSSFSQIDYEILLDKDKEFSNIFADQLIKLCDNDVVLMEDDIVLCRDFKNKIEKVISCHSGDIINFFMNPLYNFYSGYTKDFSYNQCTYYPKDKLKQIASYIKEHKEELFKNAKARHRVPTVEYLCRCSCLALGFKIYCYRPCLVQHLDTGSLINHNRKFYRRSPYFIDYLEDLNVSMKDCRRKDIQQKLYDYMVEQFDSIDRHYRIFKYKDNMIKTLIVGYGVVGSNLHKEYSKLLPDIYDKYKTEHNTKKDIKYDFCFICVDTPYVDKSNPCDLTQVKEALEENDANIYIIKSTVLPGTVDKLKEETGKHIIFSPEYYGGTQHCNNFEFDFTILGGDKEDCIKVQQLLQQVYDARHTFRITDAKTAELAKYMENSYLGMKVAFCNQFYNIAESYNIDYEDLRELFILDPRVNPSHTFIYREHPYYESHCLDKDIPAITHFAKCDTSLLKNIIAYNDTCKIRNKKK